MIGHKNLLTACFAALLALGLAACGTTGDDAPAAAINGNGDTNGNGEGMPGTKLEVAQNAAEDAAMAADDFATLAEAAADKAADAAMYLVGIQTIDPTSQGHADEARKHADLSRGDAIAARVAATAAADATELLAAYKGQLAAEDLRDTAETHGKMAESYGEMAVAVADTEVFFMGNDADGNPMYRVGGTTINAGAKLHTVVEDGESTLTGKQESISHQVAVTEEVMGQLAAPDEDDPVAAITPMAIVAARGVTIGNEVDSSNDKARLMLVTHYAGTKTVDVFAINDDVEGIEDDVPTTTAGRIKVEGVFGVDDDEDVFTALKSEGMYYAVVGDGNDDQLATTDQLAVGAKPQHVYSYFTAGSDGDFGNDDDIRTYVVLHRTVVGVDATTYYYRPVGRTVTIGGEQVGVEASLADATAYKHINFGVWAGLGEAEKSGSQAIADLGIGFVQSIGDGMTGDDMPNHGDATYNGDWVAAVQKKDEDGNGMIKLDSGAATLTADFDNGDFAAVLDGLATLKGGITGNTFTGDSASDIDHGDLDAGADFTGEFNGAFFGSQAAEAGGVFAFETEGNEGGAFTGAFGGDKKPKN